MAKSRRTFSQVRPAAGDHVHASITMFLIRPGQEGVEGLR